MKIIALLLLAALPLEAFADAPLAFSARIQSEELAEEAIDLLHCLSSRLDLAWELNEEGSAPYRLKLQEKGGRLNGSFLSPEGEKPVNFTKGDANKVCGDLAPEDDDAAEGPALPQENWEPEAKKPSWVWIGAAAAVLAGGFLLWKSRPDHRSFTME